MGKAKTVGFAVAEEDQATLDDLVAYFGNGNRSEYLRATFKVMRSVKRADELRRLQAYGQQKLAERRWTVEDVPRLVQDAIERRAQQRHDAA